MITAVSLETAFLTVYSVAILICVSKYVSIGRYDVSMYVSSVCWCQVSVHIIFSLNFDNSL